MTAAITHKSWCTDHVDAEDDPQGMCESVIWTSTGEEDVPAVTLTADGDQTLLEIFSPTGTFVTPAQAREMAAGILRGADALEAAGGVGGAGCDYLVNDLPGEPHYRQDDCPPWCRQHLTADPGTTLHSASVVYGEIPAGMVHLNLETGPAASQDAIDRGATVDMDGISWVDKAGGRDLIVALHEAVRQLEAAS